MNSDPFKAYIKETDPGKRDKGYAWHTAIGLQAVDGLKTSDYLRRTALRNIAGEISFEEANALLQSYYKENPAQNTQDRTEEADKVSARIAELLSELAFSFTPNEYLSIHRKLFRGIYSHAGQIRDYNITKKEWVLNGATVLYGTASELRATLDYDFSEEKKFSYKNLSMDEIIHHLAVFVSRLWQIHVFCEGNTRTTAVFFIKYLRTLGFDVTNDIFAENAWYFRNALVRANYNDLKKGVHETTEYLELFLRNLLLNEQHPLLNRTLHISGTFKDMEDMEKPDIKSVEPDIEGEKPYIKNEQTDIGSARSYIVSEDPEIQFRYRTQFKHEDFMLMAPARYAPLEFNMMKILLTSQGFHVNDHSFEANFHLKREDGSYNLLAELLADQNMLPLIFVKFRGKDKTAISQRSDYGGQSLLLAYQKMKARLAAENICKTDTTVRPRVDKFLYDADAVNEVLVNMLVHNDWTISEPLVSFFTDRIEFTSHGGLPHGMTEEEFFKGISQPRNAGLMRVFLSLGLVEHTGHGVPLVVEKYGREVFDIRPSYITVNIPFDKDVLASGSYDDTSTVAYGLRDAASDAYGPHFQELYARSPLSKKEEAVLMELIRNPKATYAEIAEHTGISRRTVARAIARLVEMSYIERIGNNKAGFWKINR